MDENKFEHSGQFAEGCTTGVHAFRDEIELEADGDLTKMIATCFRCGSRIEVSSPLNLNKYIGKKDDSRPGTIVNNINSQILCCLPGII